MLIGLTGGIATGKSTVSAMLKARGFVVIDSDKIARQVVEPSTETLKKIVDTFGSAILLPDGQLNRAALGKIVFSDEQARITLMEITHPPIHEEIHRQIKQAKEAGEEIIVLDVPLLIEGKLKDKVDRILLVYTDDTTQLHRLIKRDHLTKEEALKRIQAQMPIEEKRKYADIIIDNRGTLDQLEKQVDNIIHKLRKGNL